MMYESNKLIETDKQRDERLAKTKELTKHFLWACFYHKNLSCREDLTCTDYCEIGKKRFRS